MSKVRKQKPLTDKDGNRIKGGRPSLHPSVDPDVDAWVAKQAERFGVSKSFVQNTALADVAGVSLHERYTDEDISVPRRRKRMAKAAVTVHPFRRRRTA